MISNHFLKLLTQLVETMGIKPLVPTLPHQYLAIKIKNKCLDSANDEEREMIKPFMPLLENTLAGVLSNRKTVIYLQHELSEYLHKENTVNA